MKHLLAALTIATLLFAGCGDAGDGSSQAEGGDADPDGEVMVILYRLNSWSLDTLRWYNGDPDCLIVDLADDGEINTFIDGKIADARAIGWDVYWDYDTDRYFARPLSSEKAQPKRKIIVDERAAPVRGPLRVGP